MAIKPIVRQGVLQQLPVPPLEDVQRLHHVRETAPSWAAETAGRCPKIPRRRTVGRRRLPSGKFLYRCRKDYRQPVRQRPTDILLLDSNDCTGAEWGNSPRGPLMAVTASQRHAAEIARRLAKTYPDAACSLDFQSPLELLVATILAAQCTDVRVNLVTKTLFRKYPTAAHYARAEPRGVGTGHPDDRLLPQQGKEHPELLPHPAGAVRWPACPKKMEELVQLPGVGRKTANVVLGTAYGIAVGVVVDTHVARVSRRLGLQPEKDPEKIEKDLMGQFARKEWIVLSHRMIYHGRRCCTARNPKCRRVPLGIALPEDRGVDGRMSPADGFYFRARIKNCRPMIRQASGTRRYIPTRKRPSAGCRRWCKAGTWGYSPRSRNPGSEESRPANDR